VLTLTGTTGELRRGYHLIVRLGPWSVNGDRRLTAEPVGEVDAFWADHPAPAEVILDLGKSRWRWAITLETITPGVRGVLTGKPLIR